MRKGESRYAQLNEKGWLEAKYWREGLSPRAISEIIGCSGQPVRGALKRLNIPLRSRSEAQKGLQAGKKNPFWGKHPSEETKEKLRAARKKRRFPTKDTKPELIFIDFYNKFGIADRVKDTRDNSFHIGRLNPDFIIRDMRIAIFVNGDFWHSPLLRPNIRDTQRVDYQIKTCKKHRWKAMILWESDLLREDAKEFVFNVLHEYGVI